MSRKYLLKGAGLFFLEEDYCGGNAHQNRKTWSSRTNELIFTRVISRATRGWSPKSTQLTYFHKKTYFTPPPTRHPPPLQTLVCILRPNSGTKSRQNTLAVHGHLYSFALEISLSSSSHNLHYTTSYVFLQTHATSYTFLQVKLLSTVKEENLIENHTPFPMHVWRNPYRKPQVWDLRTFINSASTKLLTEQSVQCTILHSVHFVQYHKLPPPIKLQSLTACDL